MHALDIFFIVAAIFFIVVGVKRGLIGEMFRLIALVAAFFTAFLYYQELAKLCRFHPVYLSTALSFLLIFIITALAVIGAGWFLKKIVHVTPLGWVDYLFGGAIGLAKVAIIFWVVCLSLASFPPNKFILGLNRSCVFRTYKKLPPVIKLGGITKARDLLKKNIDRDVPQKIKTTKQQIERLNGKPDSAAPNIKHR